MASILSLPVLKDVVDCADFSLTVKPYLPQLLSLPSQFASIASSSSKLEDLSALYLNTNPLITGFAISLALGPIFLILSEINKNYSQVDRLWSILPGSYIAHFNIWAHLNGLPTQKLDNVLVFSTMWGARLTYNFWRKGGYQIGNEDYRWEIIKDKIGNVNMFLLNVTFISFIQSVIISSYCAFQDILMIVTGPPLRHHHTNLHPSPYLPPPRWRQDGTSRHHLLPPPNGIDSCRSLCRPTTVE